MVQQQFVFFPAVPFRCHLLKDEKILTEDLGGDGSGRVDDLEDGDKVEDEDDLFEVEKSDKGVRYAVMCPVC